MEAHRSQISARVNDRRAKYERAPGKASWACTWIVMLASVQLGSISSTTPRPIVRVVIWPNLAITLSPDSVSHGAVIFKIKNRDNHSHQFAINGRTSPQIKPHKTIEIAVLFKKPSVYSFTLPDATGWNGVGGQIRVT